MEDYPSVYTTPTNILSRPIARMMTYPLGISQKYFRLGNWSLLGFLFIILGLLWGAFDNNRDL